VIFIVMTIPQLAAFSGARGFTAAVGAAGLIFGVAYVLRSLREVYGGGWLLTVAKAAVIAGLYLVFWVGGIVAVLAWASYFR
jgi:hypothetical protein